MTDWKRKLAAYLHDPPSKCLDIRGHGDRSDAAFRQAGFTGETVGDYSRPADHVGAAADRLPFPGSLSAGLTCRFDGIRNAFLHPLSGQKNPFHAEFKSQELVFDGEGSVQPVLSEECLAALADDDERDRARFFAHWRLWPRNASERDYRMALLPADTRIPDHSIWTHMGVVSAMSGCFENGSLRPAFLRFQLGPVQEFIAAARSIRDLWSGSYLLSWLMAAGLKALSADAGPDSVIFPSLRDQPLFDLHWQDDLWSRVSMAKGSKSVWESLAWTERELLTPNLPNVFLAVVPAARADELAKKVKGAIEAEWERIADAVWKECEQAKLTLDEADFTAGQRKQRFDTQVARFLSVSWRATPWPESLEAALALADGFAKGMPIEEARRRVQAVKDMAERQMPQEHRDSRFYIGGKDGPKNQLNNLGLGWSVIVALNQWELDAVRQTRAFDAANSGGWQVGTFSNKDALTGREEAVAGGQRWVQRAADAGSPWVSLFKKNDWLAAPSLIKRTWHRAYLATLPWGLKTDPRHFPMPNTRGVASREPERDCGDDETAEEAMPSEKYFAVLAFDGDEIGRWISGEKTPTIGTQLADYTDGSGAQRDGARAYFEKPEFDAFLAQQRPLSPSYHLQFSEALGNFALLCARPVVEAFKGRLIYAGGDDVLALLPADEALACAQALRSAFQGQAVNHPSRGELFSSPAPGFLHAARKDDQGQPISFLVPGPAADVSVGIAIAHFKAPLQDVVRAAHLAEKRAKQALGRSAVAVTLMKRSGEIIEWGAKWTRGLAFYDALAAGLDSKRLSSKFPHRFAELLEAYVTESTPLARDRQPVQPVAGFPVDDLLRTEIGHCLSRQRGPAYPKDLEAARNQDTKILRALDDYLESLNAVGWIDSERRLQSVIGLCQTVAFAHRTDGRASDHSPEPKGNA
jgi:CRISPR-associated protein Cmr2